MAVETIHQCPRCELRFAYLTELEDHLRRDHLPAPEDDVPAPSPAVGGVITVPIDPAGDSRLAVPIAAALARQAGMGVEIVAVPRASLSSDACLADPIREAIAGGAPRAHGHLLVAYRPAGAIVDRVEHNDSALVCMATRSRTAVGEVVLGSVSAAVVRASPVPVLLVGPAVRQVGERVRRLVACLDGSELAERALPFATDLAQRLTAELVLVRVVPEGRIAPGDIPEIAYLRDLAERLPGPPPLFDVVQDRQPARAITRHVGDRGDALVVVATHGRGGLRKAVMGSVARGITHQAGCPVLVVPPRAAQRVTPGSGGAVSPLTGDRGRDRPHHEPDV
jgi:nucleotide-binding universal stress UspA family protein